MLILHLVKVTVFERVRRGNIGVSEGKEEELWTVGNYTRGRDIETVKFLRYNYLSPLYIGKP